MSISAPARFPIQRHRPFYAGCGPVYMHPAVLNTVIWLLVAFLYTFKLAAVQIIPTAQIWTAALIICLAFLGGSALAEGASTLSAEVRKNFVWDQRAAWRRVQVAFAFWLAVAVFEIVASQGLPLLWLLTANGRSYVDFGVESINGLMISLLVACGLASLWLFFEKKQIRYLLMAGMPLLWGLLVISRAIMVCATVEGTVLWILWRRPRLGRLTKVGLVAGASAVVFGAIGNLRSGNGSMIRIVGFTPWAAKHLPTSLLWVYAYMVTPIGNLVFTADLRHPLMNGLMPNTIAVLFPSVIRNVLYHNLRLALSGLLINPILNVSTAYVGPYQDLGWIGVAAYAAFWGALITWLWSRPGMRSATMYAVLAFCELGSIFFNMYFYLPYLAQLLWLFWIMRPARDKEASVRRPYPAWSQAS